MKTVKVRKDGNAQQCNSGGKKKKNESVGKMTSNHGRTYRLVSFILKFLEGK